MPVYASLSISADTARECCPFPELATFSILCPCPVIRKALGISRPTFIKYRKVLGLDGKPATPHQVVLLCCLIAWCHYGVATGQARYFSRHTFLSEFEKSCQLKRYKSERWNVIANQMREKGISPIETLNHVVRACSADPDSLTVDCQFVTVA